MCRVQATSSVRTQLFGLYAQGHVQYTIPTNSTFIKISKIDWKWKLFNLFRPEFRPVALCEDCMGTLVWWSGRCSPEWRPNYIFQPGDLPHQAPRVISEINTSTLSHFQHRWKELHVIKAALLQRVKGNAQKLFMSADYLRDAINNYLKLSFIFRKNKCRPHESSWHLQFLESSIFHTVFRRLLWDLAREQKQQHSWDVCKFQYVVRVLVEPTAVLRIKVQRENAARRHTSLQPWRTKISTISWGTWIICQATIRNLPSAAIHHRPSVTIHCNERIVTSVLNRTDGTHQTLTVCFSWVFCCVLCCAGKSSDIL